MENFARAETADLRQAESLRNAANWTESHSQRVNWNLQQAFVEYCAKKYPEQADRVIGNPNTLEARQN